MFPAPQPISVERKHFGQLNGHPYVVSPKADGERFLMVALGDRSVLINRAFEEMDIKFKFKKDAYQGTVLDVELGTCGAWFASLAGRGLTSILSPFDFPKPLTHL